MIILQSVYSTEFSHLFAMVNQSSSNVLHTFRHTNVDIFKSAPTTIIILLFITNINLFFMLLNDLPQNDWRISVWLSACFSVNYTVYHHFIVNYPEDSIRCDNVCPSRQMSGICTTWYTYNIHIYVCIYIHSRHFTVTLTPSTSSPPSPYENCHRLCDYSRRITW